MYYFPLVGFIIGIITYLVSLLVGIMFPRDALVIAIIAVFTEVFLTEFHKGMYYFPLVGFIIGIITYLVSLLVGIMFPRDALVIAIIAVFTEVFLTGALHLDGLGDTADAFFSNRDKDRMLEIMKDSRLGTNSLLVIMFTILIIYL